MIYFFLSNVRVTYSQSVCIFVVKLILFCLRTDTETYVPEIVCFWFPWHDYVRVLPTLPMRIKGEGKVLDNAYTLQKDIHSYFYASSSHALLASHE